MADSVNNFQSFREENLHRRVQQRIASRYLEEIDPDGVFLDDEQKSKLQAFKEIDPAVKEKFDKQNRQFKRTESAYSIQNILWLIGSIATFYYTDFYIAVTSDPRINRLWLNIGVMLIGVNISIAVFCIVWLSWIQKVPSDEWEKRYPAAIPIATACFIIGGILLTIGLWPVWGPLTPVILFTLFMGFIVVVAMIPNF